jgi:Ca-activated chloride channel family protein
MGYRLAFEHFYPSANNRVILCSDGVANTGATNPDTLVDMVRGYVDEGISLVTIGFGMGNYNDALMERLADGGDGSYHYVNQFEEARRLFTEDLTATLEVIAYDAKIQVEFNPETVARYRLIGYENRAIADEDFRNDSVDAGEVGAGMSATALYETELLPGAEGWIARANLRWQDADTREVREIAGDIFTRNLATPFYDTDPHFQLTAAAAAFAEVLRASPYVDATYSEIAEYAGRAANGMPENGQARELTDLIWHAARISRSR